MAVGDAQFPEMSVLDGVRLGTAMAGIKKPAKRDLVVIEVPEGASVAGTFTRNAFCAAPVHVAKDHLSRTAPRYLLINTGNANAGTGAQGRADAERCCHALAELTGVDIHCVLPFSTGVIGEPLPVDRITAGLPQALAALGEDQWAAAAEGILTTDTRIKGASRSVELSGGTVTFNGISKGSGMIQPNMATMLGFVACDARIEPATLSAWLRDAVQVSFNSITVDSDTSTNDACMLIATGRGPRVESGEDERLFREALTDVLTQLAQAIIRDAEGATKFVTLEVEQASSVDEARAVAFTVAHSPLVKTALYACDANWGRILAAIGRAPIESLDVDRVVVDLNSVRLVEKGGRADSYTEEAGSREMAKEEITIRIELGRGDQRTKVWTSDLSHDYVSINADYRS